jgi:hypothetical protein
MMKATTTESGMRDGGGIKARRWFVALFAAAFCATPRLASADTDCIASRVIGNAAIQRDGATGPVRPGLPLRQGDRLSTEAGARVEIGCADGSIIVVGDRTTVRLSILLSGGAQPRNAVLELAEGILRMVLPNGHRWERFDIVTRTAVASVRSTTWIVDATPDTTGVFVAEGGVLVSSRADQAQVFLQPGFGVDVGTQPQPLEVKAWGAPRVENATSRTRLP